MTVHNVWFCHILALISCELQNCSLHIAGKLKSIFRYALYHQNDLVANLITWYYFLLGPHNKLTILLTPWLWLRRLGPTSIRLRSDISVSDRSPIDDDPRAFPIWKSANHVHDSCNVSTVPCIIPLSPHCRLLGSGPERTVNPIVR